MPSIPSSVEKNLQRLSKLPAKEQFYDARRKVLLKLKGLDFSHSRIVAALLEASENDPNSDIKSLAESILAEPVHVRIKEDIEAKSAAFLVSTTHLIQGKKIQEYLGVVSSVVVLGTGLASELGAGIADMFGKRASGFEDKLSQTREIAIRKLETTAMKKGADGVVGLDLDYMTLGGNMLMVSANGTAVKFEEEIEVVDEE